MNARELFELAKELTQKPCYTCESKVIAEHVLQTVNEDDDEHLTGNEESVFGSPYVVHIYHDCIEILNSTSESIIINTIKTRGQLRQLLKALGVNT